MPPHSPLPSSHSPRPRTHSRFLCSDWEHAFSDWEQLRRLAAPTRSRGGNSPGRLGHQGGASRQGGRRLAGASRPGRGRLAVARCAAPLPRAPPLPPRSLPIFPVYCYELYTEFNTPLWMGAWRLNGPPASPVSNWCLCSPACCQEGPLPSLLHPVSARPGPTRPSTCGSAKEPVDEHT